jgi:diadenylate cyclase
MPEIIWELLNWRNIIDILLITAGLFVLYRTIRRRGTWKIMAGILVAMSIFLMANFLELYGIKWIYSNLSNVILIAFIVIFQPELRKIFEQTVSLRRKHKSDPTGDLAQMIIEGLFSLADLRRGAIIVLPGREPVEEFLSGGYPLGAVPSFPLMMSIFDPHSPGHDGALVISRGLFDRFGVRLPVSESSSLSEDYGTRHHAAMGLAEKTDSMIFVVSEERGRISIFHQGKMRKGPTRKHLAESIRNQWETTFFYPIQFHEGETRRSLLYQALVSLGLAIFFWSTIIVAQIQIVEKVISVPMEYSAAASRLVLVGEREKEMQLYLSGTKSTLDSLNSADLSINVDLSKYGPGTQTVYITSDNIRLPRGVKLLETIPSKLELTLAAITEQRAVISPQLVGSLSPGLQIEAITINPESVKVMSPVVQDNENQISVTTTPIYLDGIKSDIKVLCKIIAPQTIQPAGKQWPDVEVSIRIKK